MRTLTWLGVAAALVAGCSASHPGPPTPAPALAHLEGRLLTTDPVSGRTETLGGDVVITGPSTTTIAVDPTGRFRLTVRAGVYTVGARVPDAQPDFRCGSKHDVTVQPGATVSVTLQCESDAG